MKEEVKLFLSQMSDTESFDALTDEDKDKTIFTSSERLKAMYGGWRKMSPVVIAFQVLYDLESKGEHYHQLKRQGVKSFSTKGISVQFDSLDAVSPEVVRMIGNPPRKAGTGRLM